MAQKQRRADLSALVAKMRTYTVVLVLPLREREREGGGRMTEARRPSQG